MITTPVGVLYFPDEQDAVRPRTPLARLARKLDGARRNKANPRDRGYMTALAAQHVSDARLVSATAADLSDAVRNASHVVLLWPDAIGQGWDRVERSVLDALNRDATLEALTGRRRRVLLDTRTIRTYRTRRRLERWWLGEAVLGACLVSLALALAAVDTLRGRS